MKNTLFCIALFLMVFVNSLHAQNQAASSTTTAGATTNAGPGTTPPPQLFGSIQIGQPNQSNVQLHVIGNSPTLKLTHDPTGALHPFGGPKIQLQDWTLHSPHYPFCGHGHISLYNTITGKNVFAADGQRIVFGEGGILWGSGQCGVGGGVGGQFAFNGAIGTTGLLVSAPGDYPNLPIIPSGYRFCVNGKSLIQESLVIGTVSSTPTDYKLYVEKGIISEKVKVALKSTADWSDYVFADTYTLRPLATVESYIKEHKHLPDVPSAEEMVTNGLDVAKTDAMLLQKIEELTLYIIELHKALETEKKEKNAKIEALTRQLEALQK